MPRAFLFTNRRYKCLGGEALPGAARRAATRTTEPQQPQYTRTNSPEKGGPFPRRPYSVPQLSPMKASEAEGVECGVDCCRVRASAITHRLNLNEKLEKTDEGRNQAATVVTMETVPVLPMATITNHKLTVLVDEAMEQLSENFACSDCGKRYSTASNLSRHRQTHRSVHDKKARQCPHCDKVYVSMPAYSMHVRTHSEGCQCQFCGKRFSRPWLLQGHIRTHTGERPFKCEVCSKAFADKSNLRAHVQTHSSEKPYDCSRCGKAFALKSYLYKHEESSCMRGVSKHSGSKCRALAARRV